MKQSRLALVIAASVLAFIGGGCTGAPTSPNDNDTNPWRQFLAGRGLVYYCSPGQIVRLGCATEAIPCEGNPELRVCEMTDSSSPSDCAAGRLRIIAEFRNEEFGRCPAGSYVCPANGQSVIMIRSITPGQPYRCAVGT
jgi:hypothetical protein